MPYHEELSPSASVKKLPEGSKAEKIRTGVEVRLAEVTTAIAECTGPHSSDTNLV